MSTKSMFWTLLTAIALTFVGLSLLANMSLRKPDTQTHQAGEGTNLEGTMPSLTNLPTSDIYHAQVEQASTLPVVQSRDGYTATLYPLYADANRLVVSYTLAGPLDRDIDALWLGSGANSSNIDYRGPIIVETSSNKMLPPRATESYGLVREGPGRNSPGQSGTYMLAFDTSALAPLPSKLHLIMTCDLFVSEASGGEKAGTPGLAPLISAVAHNFRFDFVISTNALRRTLDLSQQVNVGGTELTLERIDVSLSEVHLRIKAKGNDGAFKPNWQPNSITIHAGNQQRTTLRKGAYPLSGLSFNQKTGAWWDCYVPFSALDETGEWTVIVDELYWGEFDTMSIDKGPWTFHFTLPPASSKRMARTAF